MTTRRFRFDSEGRLTMIESTVWWAPERDPAPDLSTACERAALDVALFGDAWFEVAPDGVRRVPPDQVVAGPFVGVDHGTVPPTIAAPNWATEWTPSAPLPTPPFRLPDNLIARDLFREPVFGPRDAARLAPTYRADLFALDRAIERQMLFGDGTPATDPPTDEERAAATRAREEADRQRSLDAMERWAATCRRHQDVVERCDDPVLRDVASLHAPDHNECVGCVDEDGDTYTDWPCLTFRVIERAVLPDRPETP